MLLSSLPGKAVVFDAVPPTSFCWPPPNPASASVFHSLLLKPGRKHKNPKSLLNPHPHKTYLLSSFCHGALRKKDFSLHSI